MKTIECLVTGGGGFLGRHIVRTLEELGNNVTVLSRRLIDGRRTIVSDIAESGLELGDTAFGTVYHLAGLAHQVPRTATEQQQFYQVNSGGTTNLLCALERNRELPDAIVFMSTVAVYGLEQGVLLDEETPRNATDPYGTSKLQAEDTLLTWGARHGVRTAVIRLPLVVGREAPGNLGALVGALRRGRYVGIGSGSARRSMVLANDVAAILPEAARVGGIFHLTDGYHPSFAELEKALTEAMGKKSPRRLGRGLAKLGASIGDGLDSVTGITLPLNTKTLTKMTSTLTFSDERARKLLGWNPSSVLDHAAEIV